LFVTNSTLEKLYQFVDFRGAIVKLAQDDKDEDDELGSARLIEMYEAHNDLPRGKNFKLQTVYSAIIYVMLSSKLARMMAERKKERERKMRERDLKATHNET